MIGTEDNMYGKLCTQKKRQIHTHSGEEHVVEEEGDGHNDQDQLPRLPGRVEVGANGGAGHILSRLGAHPQASAQPDHKKN